MLRDSGQAGIQLEITPAMIAAGIIAGDLENFEFGWSDPTNLVTAVYRAMASAASPLRQTDLGEGVDMRGMTHGVRS